ncbi:hypothetical protein GCM10027296_44960 [Chitinimonas naiadis]
MQVVQIAQAAELVRKWSQQASLSSRPEWRSPGAVPALGLQVVQRKMVEAAVPSSPEEEVAEDQVEEEV